MQINKRSVLAGNIVPLGEVTRLVLYFTLLVVLTLWHIVNYG